MTDTAILHYTVRTSSMVVAEQQHQPNQPTNLIHHIIPIDLNFMKSLRNKQSRNVAAALLLATKCNVNLFPNLRSMDLTEHFLLFVINQIWFGSFPSLPAFPFLCLPFRSSLSLSLSSLFYGFQYSNVTLNCSWRRTFSQQLFLFGWFVWSGAEQSGELFSHPSSFPLDKRIGYLRHVQHQHGAMPVRRCGAILITSNITYFFLDVIFLWIAGMAWHVCLHVMDLIIENVLWGLTTLS